MPCKWAAVLNFKTGGTAEMLIRPGIQKMYSGTFLLSDTETKVPERKKEDNGNGKHLQNKNDQRH